MTELKDEIEAKKVSVSDILCCWFTLLQHLLQNLSFLQTHSLWMLNLKLSLYQLSMDNASIIATILISDE